MDTDKLNEKLKALQAQRQELRVELEETLKNREVPLEDRWELFEEHGESILETTGWIEHFKTLDQASKGSSFDYCDEFYVERRQELTYVFIIERLEDRLDNKFYENDTCLTEEQINELKEEMLQTGHCGFVNDW